VEALLREASVEHGFSRFANAADRTWSQLQAVEAASLLSVVGSDCYVSFDTFCAAVESPEPWLMTSRVVEVASSSTFVWTPLFHSDVIEVLFPNCLFDRQVQLLTRACSARGVYLPAAVWLRVITFLHRDLETCGSVQIYRI
ncbi:unnamed protein product, partial [Polarella glacialis]